MEKQFERTEMLIGAAALETLKSKHVAVFGLGGVGSYAVEALARCGVGKLTLIDNDTVAPSNINRQLYALNSTVGMKKTDAARNRVLDINPECTVRTIAEFYLPDSRELFFTENYDYIIDAIDTVTAKIDLALEAEKRKIPIISCMGTGNKLDPSRFEFADIYKTSVCPLCRVMRAELRKRNVKALTVLFSKEEPITLPNKTGTKNVPASISFVPSVAGLMLASKAVREIVK